MDRRQRGIFAFLAYATSTRRQAKGVTARSQGLLGCGARPYCFWLATPYAFSEQKFELVLALCDRWERSTYGGSANPQALRAGAHFAMGNLTQARACVNRAG